MPPLVNALSVLILFAGSILAKRFFSPAQLSTFINVLYGGRLRRPWRQRNSFYFEVLLQQTGKCGCHLVWRKRAQFTALREGIPQDVISIILIGTFGPSDAEQEVLQSAAGTEIVTILHFSDEMFLATNPSIYGKAGTIFRNYYHHGMGQHSIDYLLEISAPPHTAPKVFVDATWDGDIDAVAIFLHI